MKAFDKTNALSGVRAIITGASQGLGEEIAKQYVTAGAQVCLCARDLAKLQAVAAGLGKPAVLVQADVANPQDCERVVATAVAQLGGVDVLVNNAGVYGPKGAIADVDWAEWVQAMHINVMGSVMMARLVVPHMQAAGRGKIIQLSGGGATNPLPNISAYAASKAAIVRFAETLAEELRGTGIDVNCIAPGALNTRMLDEVIAAGPDSVGQAFYDRAVKQKTQGGAGLVKGAELAVYLASAASDGLTAKLLSALWDPWREFHTHIEDLNTDIYTLRRIVPKERGMAWGD
jgi:NAD(P)-dependent dehydrogenase (short-subunit alcohol dehydrogenase family)